MPSTCEGLEGQAVFIDTEGSFNVSRLEGVFMLFTVLFKNGFPACSVCRHEQCLHKALQVYHGRGAGCVVVELYRRQHIRFPVQGSHRIAFVRYGVEGIPQNTP